MAATEGSFPPVDPYPDILPMTLWGVPLVEVFTEWHRRWVTDPDAYASEVEALEMQDASYGEASVAYLVALGREMGGF